MALAVDPANRNSSYFNWRTTVPNNRRMDEVDSNERLFLKAECNRLATFRNWQYTFVEPTKLAEAGFYSVHQGDTVRCAFCSIDVGQWEEGDDPMVDHRRWSPGCPFIRGLECGNVPKNAPVAPTSRVSLGSDVCGIYDYHVMPNSVSERFHRPIFPNYATIDERLKSFGTWPANKKPNPKDLAAAGFFYRGMDDQTICFYCRGGLRKWEDCDVPWEQHARWFPKCHFVKLQKGDDYIGAVKNKFRAREEEELSNSEDQRSESVSSSGCSSGESTSNSPLPPLEVRITTTVAQVSCPGVNSELSSPPPPPQLKENETKELCRNLPEDENKLNFEPLCKICYTKPVGILFTPCGHTVTCVDCAFTLSNCPICRQPISEPIRAFL